MTLLDAYVLLLLLLYYYGGRCYYLYVWHCLLYDDRAIIYTFAFVCIIAMIELIICVFFIVYYDGRSSYWQ